MNYNLVTSVKDKTVSPASEPVTVAEIKQYMRLEGFVDANDSSADSLSDFDFDDTLIGELIVAARESMEEHTGLSLKEKDLEAIITNLCGRIEIPYGPIRSITTLTDSDGTAITTYKTAGNMWYILISPTYQDMVLNYTAGYGTTFPLPKAIKIDLMRLVTYMYMYRGDEQKIEHYCSQLAGKYSRKTIIA